MRQPLSLLVAVLTAVGLFATGLGLGATGRSATTLSAKLDSRHETPAPKGGAHASGQFTATLSGRSLSWRLTFRGLTGKAVAAHVHLGKPGVAGPVAIPLCGPCSSGAHGRSTVTARVRSALLSGGAYVNVHTSRNSAGEIRGQVGVGTSVTPAPPTTTTTSTDTSGGYG